jgi:hypothetical protein
MSYTLRHLIEEQKQTKWQTIKSTLIEHDLYCIFAVFTLIYFKPEISEHD